MSKPSAKEFAAKGKQYIGTPYGTMDCQALVERMLSEVGVKKDWKGSNAIGRDLAWVGTPEDCKAMFGSIPAGAFLLIWDGNGGEIARGYHDGLGNFSHIGVRTDSFMGAIHSSATKGGVAESYFADKTIQNGGWNRVGFCKLLDYGAKIEALLYGSNVSEEQTETPWKPAAPATECA